MSKFNNFSDAVAAYDAFHGNCRKRSGGCRHSFYWNCESCGRESGAGGDNLSFVEGKTQGRSLCVDCYKNVEANGQPAVAA